MGGVFADERFHDLVARTPQLLWRHSDRVRRTFGPDQRALLVGLAEATRHRQPVSLGRSGPGPASGESRDRSWAKTIARRSERRRLLPVDSERLRQRGKQSSWQGGARATRHPVRTLTSCHAVGDPQGRRATASDRSSRYPLPPISGGRLKDCWPFSSTCPTLSRLVSRQSEKPYTNANDSAATSSRSTLYRSLGRRMLRSSRPSR
jgi:hypothetical protein